jgi:hypothetical protein
MSFESIEIGSPSLTETSNDYQNLPDDSTDNKQGGRGDEDDLFVLLCEIPSLRFYIARCFVSHYHIMKFTYCSISIPLSFWGAS